MKIRQTTVHRIDVPERFQTNWEPIVHSWIDTHNDVFPDDIIEDVEPQIEYYTRNDGESMMEGYINITLSYLIDATKAHDFPH